MKALLGFRILVWIPIPLFLYPKPSPITTLKKTYLILEMGKLWSVELGAKVEHIVVHLASIWFPSWDYKSYFLLSLVTFLRMWAICWFLFWSLAYTWVKAFKHTLNLERRKSAILVRWKHDLSYACWALTITIVLSQVLLVLCWT